MSRPMFRAAVARRDISPDNPQLLTPTGMVRLVPTRGVLDPLYVEALAIEAGGELAFLITSDLRAISPACSREIRQRIAKRTGCDPKRVLLSSNHNHCSSPELPGPRLMAQMPGDAAENEAAARAALEASDARILKAFVDACDAAHSQLQPAEIAATRVPVTTTIGENRRMRLGNGVCVQCWGAGAVMPPGEKLVGPAGPTDEEIAVVCVRGVGDKLPFAILTSYSAHIHLYELPYFSGEVAGACKREIEKRLAGATAMYASGTPGDIDMHCVHPMPAGEEADEVRWFQESAALLAGRFAGAVVPAVQSLSDYQQPESFVADQYTNADEPGEPQRITLLQALRLGEIDFVTLLGEMFMEYGQQLRARAPSKHLFLMGYNGSDSWYTPTLLGFEQGSYEAMRGPARSVEEEMMTTDSGERIPSRKARPESGAEIVDRIVAMLERIAAR